MMIKSCPLAEDIVQDCFLSLWQHRRNIDKNKAKNYLIKTAYYNIVNNIRKKNIEQKYLNQTRKTNDINNYNGVKDAINYYLDKLSEFQKDVLILKDMQGYSYEEIAKITGKTLETIKITIYRARKKLKELMVNKENII